MLPLTGAISFNDINVELGHTGTDLLGLGTALSEMGFATDPDTVEECRGYDHGWLGWIAAEYYIDQGSYLDIYCYNYSTISSHSKTIYWKTELADTLRESGSFDITDLEASTSIFSYATISLTYDAVYVRYSSTGSWVLLEAGV